MAEKNNKKTPFEEYQDKIKKKIMGYKLVDEATVVSMMYKNPDLLKENSLSDDDFHGEGWKSYFKILKGLIINEKKMCASDIDIGLYLKKHPRQKAEYDKYGGYDTIEEALERYVSEPNFDSCLEELRKWNTILKLINRGFPIDEKKLSNICDMSLDELYDEYNVYLNDIFSNVENNVQAYNGFDGMKELVDELDEGNGIGIPFANCDVLNAETGGMLGGNIIGIGASSGVGKSTLSINYVFPSMVKYDLKALFIINEEDQNKFKKEALIWYCTNVLKKPIQKRTLRDGGFDSETKEALYRAAEWFDNQKENHNVTIIPLERYTAKTVVKLLKKWSHMVDVIVLDTLKESADSRDKESWKSMMTDCVDFYDCIKHTDACMIVTYQLVKNKSRFLTNADIGVSKGILDIFSVNLFFRRPLQSELKGGKDELYCYKTGGEYGSSKMQLDLEKDKHYMICFISKNRFGNSGIQIVSEADFSINKYEDLGYCVVPEDF